MIPGMKGWVGDQCQAETRGGGTGTTVFLVLLREGMEREGGLGISWLLSLQKIDALDRMVWEVR